MKCPKCPSVMTESTNESTLSARVYRCPGCHSRFKYITANGHLKELVKVGAAWGVLLTVLLAVLGMGGWS